MIKVLKALRRVISVLAKRALIANERAVVKQAAIGKRAEDSYHKNIIAIEETYRQEQEAANKRRDERKAKSAEQIQRSREQVSAKCEVLSKNIAEAVDLL